MILTVFNCCVKVYDTSIISPLIAVLQQALANGRVGMPAVLALTVRRRETFAEFARQAGLFLLT
jgi:hypothetical protein